MAQGDTKQKQSIILYNVVPISVDIDSEGTIHSINGEVQDYLEGYTLVKNKISLDPSATGNEVYEGPKDGYTTSKQVYNLRFNPQMAKLSRETMAAMDQSISAVAQDPSKKVMLTSYAPNGAEETILLKNRLSACLLYFQIKGLSKRQIAINEIPQESDKHLLIATILL